MKTDGFGIHHRPQCQGPRWQTVPARPGTPSASVQQCRSCGITWRPGDPSNTPQPTSGYTERNHS